MRISDWSSDVCSSDLLADGVERAARDRALRHRQVDAQRLEPLRQLDQIGQFAIGARQIGLRQLMFDGAHANDAFAACGAGGHAEYPSIRSEEHTSELQSLMRISYAAFCLKKTT